MSDTSVDIDVVASSRPFRPDAELNAVRVELVAILSRVFQQFERAQPRVGLDYSQLSARLDRKSFNVFVKSVPLFANFPELVLAATFERSCRWGMVEEERLVAVEVARRVDVERQRVRLLSRQRRREREVGTRDNGLKDQRRRSSASRKRFGAVHASEKLMSAEWSRIDPGNVGGATFDALLHWVAENFPLLAQRAQCRIAFRATRTRSKGDVDTAMGGFDDDYNGFVERGRFEEFLERLVAVRLSTNFDARVRTAPMRNVTSQAALDEKLDHFPASPRTLRAMLGETGMEAEDEDATHFGAAAALSESSEEEEPAGPAEEWQPPCTSLTLAGFVAAVESMVLALVEVETAAAAAAARAAVSPTTADRTKSRAALSSASSSRSARPTTATLALQSADDLLPVYAAVHQEIDRVFNAASPARMYRRAPTQEPQGLLSVTEAVEEWNAKLRAERRAARAEQRRAEAEQRALDDAEAKLREKRSRKKRTGSARRASRVGSPLLRGDAKGSRPRAKTAPKEVASSSTASGSKRAHVVTPGSAGRHLKEDSFLPRVADAMARPPSPTADELITAAPTRVKTVRISTPEVVTTTVTATSTTFLTEAPMPAAAAAPTDEAQSQLDPSKRAVTPRNDMRPNYKWLRGSRRGLIDPGNHKEKSPAEFFAFSETMHWECPACDGRNTVLRSYVAVRTRRRLQVCRVACGLCAASHIAANVVPELIAAKAAATAARSSAGGAPAAAPPSPSASTSHSMHAKALQLVQTKVTIDPRDLTEQLAAGKTTVATQAYEQIMKVLQMKQFCTSHLAELSKEGELGGAAPTQEREHLLQRMVRQFDAEIAGVEREFNRSAIDDALEANQSSALNAFGALYGELGGDSGKKNKNKNKGKGKGKGKGGKKKGKKKKKKKKK
jgi:hypothetical protein